MTSNKEQLERLLVGMTRLEEGMKSVQRDVKEARGGIEGLDQRLRAVENWRIWILGWTTAIATAVSVWVKNH